MTPDSFYDGVSDEEEDEEVDFDDDEFAWFDGYDDDEEEEDEDDDMLAPLPTTPGAHTAVAYGLSDEEEDDDDGDKSEMADQGSDTVTYHSTNNLAMRGLLTLSQRAALGAWLDAFRKRWSSYWNYLDYTTMQV